MDNLPTSDLKRFEEQLNNPNKHMPGSIRQEKNVQKIQKNLVISYLSDSTGCGHIRNIFPMTYVNSVFGKGGKIIPFIAPFFLFQHDLLVRARTLYFQRTMNPYQINQVKQYRDLKRQYQYKLCYDIDDFIWKGPNPGECIPDYNLASTKIGDDVRKASIIIMNLMDTVCVSTEFLKKYLSEHGVTSNIVVVPNTIPKYFWGGLRRPKITKKIEKPKVIYTGSPTHYCNQRKMVGDWENSWLEWIIKNVKDNKIDFCCMGGLPFFFESIKNKIHVINWLNSYQYHLPILKFKPDVGIAPLVPNYFNFSKSDIKHIEYCAAGCISMGTTFSNGMPSPYDNNFSKVSDKASVDNIEEEFQRILEPDTFNDIITKQYDLLDNDGRWLESPKFVNFFVGLL